MSHRRKLSVILLGSDGPSKDELLTKIFNDCHKSKTKTIVYENDWCQVFCPQDKSEVFDSVKKYFNERGCDMCLLLLDDGITVDRAWQQMDELHKKSEISVSVIRPVLPQRDTTRTPSLRNCALHLFTVDEVCSEVRNLAENRHKLRKDSPLSSGGNTHSKEAEISGSRVNLVLLGLTGTGKSACGNTILGYQYFMSKMSDKPVTTTCQKVESEVHGTHVRVIDMPDIFSDDMTNKDKHVKTCRELCQGDPCVFLLVIQTGRFTNGERDIIAKLEKAFGHGARNKTVILFTNAEELLRAEMTKDDYLRTCNPNLKRVIEACSYRCVFLNNKDQSLDKVAKLMKVVEMVEKTLPPEMDFTTSHAGSKNQEQSRVSHALGFLGFGSKH